LVDTDSQYHDDLIIDQFTKQTIPFTQNAAHSAKYAIEPLVTLSNVSKKDTVLDVACGLGLVSCELAKVAHHIIGIDITPAMIEQANLLRQEKNLCNIKYEIGDVTHLPYYDASFSIVFTRYSFHHLVDPSLVLNEMKRVCMRKGSSCN
jgi:ubiquinone/menaquinone biosynthesis C-methylase UbiE